MTDKIYLSPAVADVTRDYLHELTQEVKALRRGQELYVWEESVDRDGEDIDED